MGQFSFRVSSNVTVRKWLEPGSSQRFFHLCLILESGRLKKLGLLGYFSLSLSLSWSDSSKGILQILQTLQISPWISCSSITSIAFYSSWQSHRPTWFQEKGHGLYLLMRGGSKNLMLQNHHAPSHALFSPVTQFTFTSATNVTSFLWSKITLYADKISIHILLT